MDRMMQQVRGALERWDEWVDRRLPSSWGRLSPSKRTWFAALLGLEVTAATLVFGFVVGDLAAWVISLAVWVSVISFCAGLARNPARAFRTLPRVLVVFFGLAVIAWLGFVVVLLTHLG